MQTNNLIGLVPLIPLLGFVIIILFNKNLTKSLVALLGCGTVLISFLLSLILFLQLKGNAGAALTQKIFDWIAVDTLNIGFSFLVDPLSIVMMLVITGVGFLIHVYSSGYMYDDDGHNRFFAYLNLFVFFMLLLVMGSNFLIMFIGWEGVGLSSYLLIGFWYKNTEYNKAASKAFIMNRIGDLGLILGIILILVQFGSLEYSEVLPKLAAMPSGDEMIIAITLLLFVGAIGKSAQLPLHTWLPDAMAGPTPVSALIHAATMVTAGIYLVARNNIMYSLAPLTSNIILILGISTSVMAALIALRQNDIKKVLAYSTVSQLGLMFVAMGAHAYTAGMFHLVTHAFFKALLFLGAGSVIHAMQGEQDIRQMGGLRKQLPYTWITFLIGTIAIAGIPIFAGFFSKDEILINAFGHNISIWAIASFSSFLTALYMFRLLFIVFMGDHTRKEGVHVHESAYSMTIPLMVLAILSTIGGFLNVPSVLGGGHSFSHFLSSVITDGEHHISHSTELILMAAAVMIAFVGIGLAYQFFVKKLDIKKLYSGPSNFLQSLQENKFYLDEIYQAAIIKPLHAGSSFLFNIIDKKGIDGVVNDLGFVANQTNRGLRRFQSGNTGYYILIMVIGIICFLISSVFIFN